MAKKKHDLSLFINVKKAEALIELGDHPDMEDFINGFMDILKTPILLRIMAKIIEKNEKLPLKMMAKEINYRMMQIINEEVSSQKIN